MTDRRSPRVRLAAALALFLAPASAWAAEAAPARAAEPAPDRTNKPAPDRTNKPAPDRTNKPAPDRTNKPAPDRTNKPDAPSSTRIDTTAAAEPDSTPKSEAPADPKGEADPAPVGPTVDPDTDVVPEREAIHTPEAVEPGAKSIGLDEGIALALRRHPALRAARQQVAVAKARVGQAKAAYLPRIDVGLQYVWASENGSPASVHSFPGMSRVGGSRRRGLTWTDAFHNDLVVLAVNQVIYDFGRTKGSVGGRRFEALVAEMSLVQAEQQVTYGVMQAFYQVRAAREMVRVAEDIHVTAQAILALADAAREVGLKPPSESARAEANVAAAEVALIQARARLELSQVAVAGALGVIDEVYLPRENDAPPKDVLDAEKSVAIALHSRPELKLLGFRREGLQQDLRRVKAQRYPRFDARASVNGRGQFLPSAGQDPYQQFNWNVGVVISIPVFQGLAVKRQIEEVEARVEVVDANRELVHQAVSVQVRQALTQVRAADAAVVASQRGVEAARKALETLEGRYREGLAKLVELTDAQATYIDARLQLVQATYDRYLSRAALDLTMGQLPP